MKRCVPKKWLTYSRVALLLLVIVFMNNSQFFVSSSSRATNQNYKKAVDKEVIELGQEDVYVAKLFDPIETFSAEMTGYSGECKGCSGKVSCSPRPNVRKTGIYFDDEEYGNIMMVAADPKYPCGTIFRFNLKRVSDDPIIAIVMDRGGAIKGNIVDLLTETEQYAIRNVGRVKNLKIEVLRLGW